MKCDDSRDCVSDYVQVTLGDTKDEVKIVCWKVRMRQRDQLGRGFFLVCSLHLVGVLHSMMATCVH